MSMYFYHALWVLLTNDEKRDGVVLWLDEVYIRKEGKMFKAVYEKRNNEREVTHKGDSCD